MSRAVSDLAGFRAALALLLNEEAYLAWCEGRGEEPVPIAVRRELADFVSVVGGDGTFFGMIHGKRELLAESGGRGWAAPSNSGPQSDPGARVWHAVQLDEAGGDPEPACGQGTVNWPKARLLGEISGVPWCGQLACQKRLAL
jgi:hypothetical protein